MGRRSVTIEMGGTGRDRFADYFRSLGGRSVDGSTFTGPFWEATVGPQTASPLGRFTVARVSIHLSVEEDRFDDLLARFHLAFLRVGG